MIVNNVNFYKDDQNLQMLVQFGWIWHFNVIKDQKQILNHLIHFALKNRDE